MTNIKPGSKCWALSYGWLEATYIEKVKYPDEEHHGHRVQLLQGGHAIVSAILPYDAFKPTEPKP